MAHSVDLLDIVSEVESLHNASIDSDILRRQNLRPHGPSPPSHGPTPRNHGPVNSQPIKKQHHVQNRPIRSKDSQPTRRQNHGPISVEDSPEVDEDLEESQVLEDVFFVM